MNGIGHFVVFGYCLASPQERMRALKDAGFDEVMLWWGDEHADTHGSPQAQWEMAQRNGLQVRTVHYPFALTNSLWLDNLDGQNYMKGLAEGLALAGKLGIQHMVIHSNKGKQPPEPNALGLNRMRALVEEAQRQQVVLALENTRFLHHQQYLYDNIPSPYLGFCFDTGHANCFTPGEDPLARFFDRLVTTHISDNIGPAGGDLHLRPGLGSIDFDSLLPSILKKSGISLNLESAYSQADAELDLGLAEYLSASYAGIARHLQTSTVKTN